MAANIRADNAPEAYTIVVEAPDTSENFTAFNISCDVLDSDFLMQPINEADYDSETQVCVDRREGNVTSFYQHYVTKRRKKKGIKNCSVEGPAPPRRGTDSDRVVQNNETLRGTEASDATVTAASNPTRSRASAPISAPPQDPSYLMATSLLGLTSGVEKRTLCNAAIRRTACGRMPPMPTHVEPLPTTKDAFPPQGETVSLGNSPAFVGDTTRTTAS